MDNSKDGKLREIAIFYKYFIKNNPVKTFLLFIGMLIRSAGELIWQLTIGIIFPIGVPDDEKTPRRVIRLVITGSAVGCYFLKPEFKSIPILYIIAGVLAVFIIGRAIFYVHYLYRYGEIRSYRRYKNAVEGRGMNDVKTALAYYNSFYKLVKWLKTEHGDSLWNSCTFRIEEFLPYIGYTEKDYYTYLLYARLGAVGDDIKDMFPLTGYNTYYKKYLNNHFGNNDEQTEYESEDTKYEESESYDESSDDINKGNIFANMDEEEAKTVYRALMKKYHPDNEKTGNAEKAKVYAEMYKEYTEKNI